MKMFLNQNIRFWYLFVCLPFVTFIISTSSSLAQEINKKPENSSSDSSIKTSKNKLLEFKQSINLELDLTNIEPAGEIQYSKIPAFIDKLKDSLIKNFPEDDDIEIEYKVINGTRYTLFSRGEKYSLLKINISTQLLGKDMTSIRDFCLDWLSSEQSQIVSTAESK